MKKDYFISVLFYHFMTFDYRSKLDFNQYYYFEELMFRRWKKKFKKDFLSKAFSCIGYLEGDCVEISLLKEDFESCFECFCKEFCK